MNLRLVRSVARSFAAALAHLSTDVTPPVPVAQNLDGASSGPAWGIRLAGEEQLGICKAELSKYYQLYMHSGKKTLAAIYLRRVRVAGRSSACTAASLAHVSTVVTPPATAAQHLGMGLRRPYRG
jgi:hypothetical protein